MLWSSTLAAVAAAALLAPPAAANGYVTTDPSPGSVPLVAGGKAAPIVVSSADYPGVTRVAGDLRSDIASVTGVQPAVLTDRVPEHGDGYGVLAAAMPTQLLR